MPYAHAPDSIADMATATLAWRKFRLKGDNCSHLYQYVFQMRLSQYAFKTNKQKQINKKFETKIISSLYDLPVIVFR